MDTKSQELEIKNMVSDISNKIEQLNSQNPLVANQVFKNTIKYLYEKNTTKDSFTIKELEEIGVLPKSF